MELTRYDAEYIEDVVDELDSMSEFYDEERQQLSLTEWMFRADKLAALLRYPLSIPPDYAADVAQRIAHQLQLLLKEFIVHRADE